MVAVVTSVSELPPLSSVELELARDRLELADEDRALDTVLDTDESIADDALDPAAVVELEASDARGLPKMAKSVSALKHRIRDSAASQLTLRRRFQASSYSTCH